MKLRFLTRLEWLAFTTGFVLMTFELAAARVLAPTVGSSMYVWTSVIGVIIAALSLGYYLGGRVADVRARASDVTWLLIATAGLVALAAVFYPHVLPSLAASQLDVRLQAVLAASLLFAPASLALGMISPYLAKLNVTSLKTSGSAVAALSAWNSIGGITGTFLTGFFLFGWVGSRDIFIILVVVLLGSTLFLKQKWSKRHWLVGSASFVVVALASVNVSAFAIDTPSAHYTVFEWDSQGARYRGLATGPSGVQSGVNIANPYEPVFWYTKELTKLIADTSQRSDILVLGGGTFTLPQQLGVEYPDARIDVVEIDPELANIAREHFFYQDPPNVQLIFEDARHYVNQTDKRYDIVVVDVYGDADVPFTLMTREYGEAVRRLIKPGGVVMANMIAGAQGGCQVLLSTLEAPYRQNFHHRALKLNSDDDAQRKIYNIIGVYSNNPLDYSGYGDVAVPKIAPYTDDFTPAERIRQNC